MPSKPERFYQRLRRRETSSSQSRPHLNYGLPSSTAFPSEGMSPDLRDNGVSDLPAEKAKKKVLVYDPASPSLRVKRRSEVLNSKEAYSDVKISDSALKRASVTLYYNEDNMDDIRDAASPYGELQNEDEPTNYREFATLYLHDLGLANKMLLKFGRIDSLMIAKQTSASNASENRMNTHSKPAFMTS